MDFHPTTANSYSFSEHNCSCFPWLLINHAHTFLPRTTIITLKDMFGEQTAECFLWLQNKSRPERLFLNQWFVLDLLKSPGCYVGCSIIVKIKDRCIIIWSFGFSWSIQVAGCLFWELLLSNAAICGKLYLKIISAYRSGLRLLKEIELEQNILNKVGQRRDINYI